MSCEEFADDVGYAAFERVLESALEAVPLRLKRPVTCGLNERFARKAGPCIR